ncbi:DinB family protein [Arthrobacter cheniae]|uniref:DinB family protein n=1 Tax=Arthrobacter cheniae TaxID=1258888 RepID=A0A3A5MCF2_9MICC|nr:DinB family protein [Arthrobacter cheniae]
MVSTTGTTSTTTSSRERSDLLETLAKHRYFFRLTLRDLTDEQAGLRTTASALTLSGLLKHVADTEEGWVVFILGGPDAMSDGKEGNEQEQEEPAESAGGGGPQRGGTVDPRFVVPTGVTVAALLERYEHVARRTDELVGTLDLDADHPLPQAPWFESGARWSARRVLLHIIAETSQHAGHADIIRESLDGAKSMG